VPVLTAPYFDQEVFGAPMLDRLADALFENGATDPAAVLHHDMTQELHVQDDGARLRLRLPFAAKGDISLKKIGLELLVKLSCSSRAAAVKRAAAAGAL
jgi:arsenite/tail-anchored protein-transporting ATPase